MLLLLLIQVIYYFILISIPALWSNSIKHPFAPPGGDFARVSHVTGLFLLTASILLDYVLYIFLEGRSLYTTFINTLVPPAVFSSFKTMIFYSI